MVTTPIGRVGAYRFRSSLLLEHDRSFEGCAFRARGCRSSAHKPCVALHLGITFVERSTGPRGSAWKQPLVSLLSKLLGLGIAGGLVKPMARVRKATLPLLDFVFDALSTYNPSFPQHVPILSERLVPAIGVPGDSWPIPYVFTEHTPTLSRGGRCRRTEKKVAVGFR